MTLPFSVNLFGHTIDTISIILLISAIFAMFVYWYETRRDGFDEESSLDLFILCILSGIILGRFTFGVIENLSLQENLLHIVKFWKSGFNLIGLTIGLLFPIVVFTRSWKWSIYRISDIFVISLSFGSVFIFLGLYLLSNITFYLFSSIVYLALFLILYKIRLRFRSGLVFSTFLFFNSVFGVFLVRSTIYLIFYTALITISLLNLFWREKRNPMKANLSTSFLNRIKSLLAAKDKRLEAEQQLLIEEDPYMSEGRDTDNEYLDDVTEDVQKEIVDLRLNAITDMRNRVRKALARLRTGTYGVCEVCGKPIEKERLEAFPETTKCMSCASKNL